METTIQVPETALVRVRDNGHAAGCALRGTPDRGMTVQFTLKAAAS
jgi:hypothetical protein